MPKKTKEELAAERERKRAEKKKQEKLEEQKWVKEVEEFYESVSQYKKNRERRGLLESDLIGWYEELDKLNKKTPTEQVTDLQLEAVNDLVKEVKELLKEDEFIQKVNVFVSAGDKPEYRDVVSILRRLKQGLERYVDELEEYKKTFKKLTYALLGESYSNIDDLKPIGNYISYK